MSLIVTACKKEDKKPAKVTVYYNVSFEKADENKYVVGLENKIPYDVMKKTYTGQYSCECKPGDTLRLSAAYNNRNNYKITINATIGEFQVAGETRYNKFDLKFLVPYTK